MKKYYGMTLRQIKTLGKIMNVAEVEETRKTLQQAINDGDIKVVSTRTSKKGVELVKLSNGKEFEKSHLSTTTYFA